MLNSLMRWLRSPSSRPQVDVLDVIAHPDAKTLQPQA